MRSVQTGLREIIRDLHRVWRLLVVVVEVLAAARIACCIAVVARDERLSSERRQELARTYAGQAMRLLRDAVRRGFRDGQHLAADVDFAPLRDRADFLQLVRNLSAGNPK